MEKLLLFTSPQEARDYRHTQGTGGWIFAPEDAGQSILFPPHICPTEIMLHPITKSRSGKLIGHG